MSSDDEDMEGSATEEHAAGSSWKPLTDLLSPEEHPLVSCSTDPAEGGPRSVTSSEAMH